jgi:hypothetical protein
MLAELEDNRRARERAQERTIAEFEAQRKEHEAAALFQIGEVSKSGLHNLQSWEDYLAQRAAFERLQEEKDAAELRAQKAERRALKNEIIKWGVRATLGAIAIALWKIFLMLARRSP